MSFKVLVSKRLLKKIEELKQYKEDIKRILLELEKFPNVHFRKNIKKLKGFENIFRIRKGKIRIILSIDFKNKVIKIEDIDFRGKVYKGI